MALIDRNLQRTIITAGATMLAGYLVKAALTAIWKGVAKSDPPLNPESKQVGMSEALAWTIASSVAVGVAGMLASRGTAALLGPDTEAYQA
jgi:hypothetical protein